MKKYNYYTFTPLATNHLKDAKRYYKLTKVKGLNTRFSKAIRATIKHILDNPGVHAIRYNNVRIAYTDRFPYGIHYTVGEMSIIIVAIIYETRE